AAAVRSDVPPTQDRIELSCARRRNRQNNRETDYDCISNQSHKSAIFFCNEENRNNLSCLNPERGGAASNRKENRMDSMSAFRASWKVRLVAFGIGIIVAVAVFGIAVVISDDLRLLYVSGALLLAVAAFFLSTKAREDFIAAVLLLFASTFLFAFLVLPQTPLLWPTVLLWVAIVV